MPYKAKEKCVYKKDTGKKVGCTKGPVKKYLAALHANVSDVKEAKKMSISQKDVMKGVRKEMPPPSKSFKDKKKYNRKDFKSFKDFYENEMGTLGAANTTPPLDSSHVAETMYADGQDSTSPAVQSLADAASREELIGDVIYDLEDLKTSHDWSKPLDNDLIKAMADTLKDAGVEPTDFYAAIDAPPEKQEQYLIYGPSSWKGGNGALQDLKNILAGNEPQEVKEDESDPASDLAMGSTSAGDTLSEATFRIGEIILDNPYGTGPKHFKGIDRIVAKSEDDALLRYIRFLVKDKKIPTNPRVLYRNAQDNEAQVTRLPDTSVEQPKYWWHDFDEKYNQALENFMDKKGPGRPGDSKRHGIKKGASLSSLDKIVKSKTASPRKKQLAHWQANMRRGKAKKSR